MASFISSSKHLLVSLTICIGLTTSPLAASAAQSTNEPERPATIATTTTTIATPPSQQGRITLPLDDSWHFVLPEDNADGIPSFADSRLVDLPHDWSIEGRYDKYQPSGRGGGYLPTGIGWYRKEFVCPDHFQGKRIFIEFDGIMANSEVYLNGALLGKRPNGYVPLAYDMTAHLNMNGKNVLYVKVDNSIQPASRWYSGSGIYRHVRLTAKQPVYLQQWSAYVKQGKISSQKASFEVQGQVVNTTSATVSASLQYVVRDSDGKVVKKGESKAVEIPSGKDHAFQVPVQMGKPHLWSVSDPYLYKVEVNAMVNGMESDTEIIRTGFRSLLYDAATGFYLNGNPMKMYGVCIHSEAGGLGAAVPTDVWRYRLEVLKGLGANAIRLSHNPVAPEFLDLCDEMGFLVMEETFDTWNAPKRHAEKGYNLFFTDWWEADTRDVVMHDRNHPCVVIWSVGNEIRDNLKGDEGLEKYLMQQNLIHELDGTRPVTMALFRPVISGVYSNGFAEKMDVVGQNYRINELVDYHAAHPEKATIGTENGHDIDTWLLLRDNQWLCGQFLWTGIDYLGESDWPRTALGAGLIDKTGAVKERGLQRKSWWTTEPMVAMVTTEVSARPLSGGKTPAKAIEAPPTKEMLADTDNPQGGLNPASLISRPEVEGEHVNVNVYTNCEEVELFADGISQGRKNLPSDAKPILYSVKGRPQNLLLKGFRQGKECCSCQENAPGAPDHLLLTVEGGRLGTGFDEVTIVRASVVDASGNLCKSATHAVSFKAEGAKILATDSGDLYNHESYLSPIREAWEGSCIVYLRALSPDGPVKLTATAVGLSGKAEIRLK